MARGWESKSVEEQISQRQANTQNSQKNKVSPQDLERKTRRAGILLARTRTLTALESSRDDRYRALLQRTLEHLNSELEKLK